MGRRRCGVSSRSAVAASRGRPSDRGSPAHCRHRCRRRAHPASGQTVAVGRRRGGCNFGHHRKPQGSDPHPHIGCCLGPCDQRRFGRRSSHRSLARVPATSPYRWFSRDHAFAHHRHRTNGARTLRSSCGRPGRGRGSHARLTRDPSTESGGYLRIPQSSDRWRRSPAGSSRPCHRHLWHDRDRLRLCLRRLSTRWCRVTGCCQRRDRDPVRAVTAGVSHR